MNAVLQIAKTWIEAFHHKLEILAFTQIGNALTHIMTAADLQLSQDARVAEDVGSPRLDS